VFNLQRKITLLILPIVLVGILVMGISAYVLMKSIIEENLHEELEAIIGNVTLIIKEKIKVAESNIDLFAQNDFVKRYALASQDERYDLLQEPLIRLFITYQKAYPDYYELRFITKKGFEDTRINNLGIENKTEDEFNSEIFKRIQQSQSDTYSGFHVNKDNDVLALHVIKKIIIRDNSIDNISAKPTLRGYLAVTISLDFIKDVINKQKVLDNGFIFSADNYGTILSTEMHKAKIKELPLDINNQFISSAKQLKNSSRDFFQSARLIEGLTIYGYIPYSDLEIKYRTFGKITVITTIVILLLALFLVYSVLRKMIVKPVIALDNAAQTMATGSLDIKIDLKQNDELGKLAESFNHMAANLRELNEYNNFIAHHDSLTGLPNRLMFHEYLSEVIENAKRYKIKFAIIYIDLDNFKKVNDSLGHQSGDLLLKEVSIRIATCLRDGDKMKETKKDMPGDMLARLGGDEFIVFLPYIQSPYDVSQIAERILEALGSSIKIEGHKVYTNASMGITIFPEDGEDENILMRNADIAMYYAKDKGKNNYQYFSSDLNNVIARRVIIENKLRKAIKKNILELHYQPKIDTRTSEIIGVEALVRWTDKDEGNISTVEFINIAEETGLIIEVGEWVINEACKQIKKWEGVFDSQLQVSVNVSSIQVDRSDLIGTIKNALENYKIDPALLDIELTESALMRASKNSIEVLNNIRRLGVSISLDDFGTGYSSLSYLREFPIDTLKIDRSFIKEISENNKEAKLVMAIISMAHSLDLKVVAEGVELKYQYDFLKEKNCDIIQGYYISKPVPKEELVNRFSLNNYKKDLLLQVQ